jgi:5-methylcytosine-specific restriction endonuclease McrA
VVVDHQIDETELVPRKKAKIRFRDRILTEWNYCCAYCAEPLGKNATLDHVIPKWKGGLTEKKNMVGGRNGSEPETTGPKPAKLEYPNGLKSK